MNTAFPAMSAAARIDLAHAATLVRRCVLAVAALLFLPSLVVAGFSHQIMAMWVGEAFAVAAAPAMQWLALAVILNAADAVVSGFIDSMGRPDVNAKFSLMELALYVPLLVGLLHVFGIQGAAIAWTLRVGLDLIARVAIAGRLVPQLRPVLRRVLSVISAATIGIALPLLVPSVVERVATMCGSLLLFATAVWLWGVDAEEKMFCFARLRLRALT